MPNHVNRFYASKTFHAGETAVKLQHRHFTGGLGGDTKQAVKQTVTESRVALDYVITRIAEGLTPDQLDLADTFFKVRSPGMLRWEVQPKFVLIRNGLSADFTLNVSLNPTGLAAGLNPDHISGYVNSYSTGRKGKISVRESVIQGIDGGGKCAALRAFIHEASHKFADTKDHYYFRRPATAGAPWDVVDARTQAAAGKNELQLMLENADSYGWFAALLYTSQL
jgi:hypothetical protein